MIDTPSFSSQHMSGHACAQRMSSLTAELLRKCSSSSSRVQVLCELFGQCSHQEQLVLLKKFPEYLKRDFISLLPPEVVVKILIYLDPKEVLDSYVLVCKLWYQIFTGCAQYWKAQCKKLGIVDKTLKDELTKYHSFKELIVSELRLEHYLESRADNIKYMVVTFGGMVTDHLVPIAPVCNRYFYHQPAECGSLSVYKAEPSASASNKIVTATHNIFPGGFLKILWSFSSRNWVILYANNGKWVKFDFSSCSTDQGIPEVKEWQDGIYNVSIFKAGICCDCEQLIVINVNLTHDCLWKLSMLTLKGDQSTPLKKNVTFSFLPTPQLKDEPFFSVKQVALLPKNSSCGNHHLLLVQYSTTVLRFLLSVTDDYCSVSSPVHIVYPNYHPSSFTAFTSNMFTLSLNRKLVGLITDDPLTLCVRDLQTNQHHKTNITHLSSGDTESVTHFKCLALGRLFTIIVRMGQHTYTLFVISTFTGKVLLQHNHKLSSLPVPMTPVELYPPQSELWLNTLPKCVHSELQLCVCLFTETHTRKVTLTSVCSIGNKHKSEKYI